MGESKALPLWREKLLQKLRERGVPENDLERWAMRSWLPSWQPRGLRRHVEKIKTLLAEIMRLQTEAEAH